MSLIETRTFTTGADMIAAARNVRNRLWKPAKIAFDNAQSRVKKSDPVDFVNSGQVITDYRGHVPKFVNTARAKARRRALELAANAEQARIDAAKAIEEDRRKAALRQIKDVAEQIRIEKEHADKLARQELEAIEKPDLSEQIKMLCLQYGFEYKEIIGKYAGKAIAAGRKEMIHIIASNNPKVSMSQIGKAFGGRDHSTIAFALHGYGIQGRMFVQKRNTSPKQSKTGMAGILLLGTGVYRVRIYHGNVSYECGRFETVKEALMAQEMQMAAVLAGVALPRKILKQRVKGAA